MRNEHQPVAVEGYPFIGLFAFFALVFALLGWAILTVISLFFVLFAIYFFRNPERYPPDEENAVISPADGKIVFIGTVPEERYFKSDVTKISIFMSAFDVHVNRAPCSGKVMDMFYSRGEFLNASLDKASLQNEQSGILLETEGGQRLLSVQIAGLIARRIVTYPRVGDELERGMRYGLIRFGSRVDVYLPVGSTVIAEVGDRVTAGETVLGYFQ